MEISQNDLELETREGRAIWIEICDSEALEEHIHGTFNLVVFNVIFGG